tara:strand:- start:20663 stop:21076 length:414 start_codon:yes stop_codon:yes gene_type:complete
MSGDTARHEQPIPRNKRLKQDDEDDAPTYVLEDTKESLTKQEYEALVSGKDSENKEEDVAASVSKPDSAESERRQKDKIAEVGAATKKRKAAKIISDEQEESKKEAGKSEKATDGKVTKKPKKKAKAVKLTFGDEEG